MPRPTRADAALALAIRELREQQGISQESVAHASGLTLSSYGRIERGLANPTWLTVVAIARALGVSVGDVVAARASHTSD